MSQKKITPSLVLFPFLGPWGYACGCFDMPPSLKIAGPTGMSLTDYIAVGGAKPDHNPFALHGSLELVDTSV